jgi:hypothetical protein
MVLRREHADRASCLGHYHGLNELGAKTSAQKLKQDWRSAIQVFKPGYNRHRGIWDG